MSSRNAFKGGWRAALRDDLRILREMLAEQRSYLDRSVAIGTELQVSVPSDELCTASSDQIEA